MYQSNNLANEYLLYENIEKFEVSFRNIDRLLKYSRAGLKAKRFPTKPSTTLRLNNLYIK